MSRALSPHVSVLRGLPAACAGLGLPSKGGDKGEEPGPAGQSLGLTAVNPEARESEGQALSSRLRCQAQCSLGIDVGVHQVGLDTVDLGRVSGQPGSCAGRKQPSPPCLPQERLPSAAEGARVRLAGACPAGRTPRAGRGGPTAVGGGGSALQPRCPQGAPAW